MSITAFDADITQQIYGRLDVASMRSFADATNDISHMYALRLHGKEDIPMECLIETTSQATYDKLFEECPLLKQFPYQDNIIIAGGFINIAMDDMLRYSDFPTSDIDVFICNVNMTETLAKVLKFFDGLHATYKEYSNIINVYLPDYYRNFQIICVNKLTVSDVIAYFHSSNVKCGIHNGVLKATPDCICTLNTKLAFVDRKRISAHTLWKILQRGYTPYNMPNINRDELLTFRSVTHRSEIDENIRQSPELSSASLIEKIKEPCSFSMYRRDCDCDTTHREGMEHVCRFTKIRYSQPMDAFNSPPKEVVRKTVQSRRSAIHTASLLMINYIRYYPVITLQPVSNIVLPEMTVTIYHVGDDGSHGLRPDVSHYPMLDNIKMQLIQICNNTFGTQFGKTEFTYKNEGRYHDNIYKPNGDKIYINRFDVASHIRISTGGMGHRKGKCVLTAKLKVMTSTNETNLSNISLRVPAHFHPNTFGYFWTYKVVEWTPDEDEEGDN